MKQRPPTFPVPPDDRDDEPNAEEEYWNKVDDEIERYEEDHASNE
jgi:hypothetical protein